MTLTKVLYQELGDKCILYRAYLERDIWTLVEASFIVSGLIPIPETLEEDSKEYRIAASIRMQAIDACLAGHLKAQQLGNSFYVKPKDFLKWITDKEWPLPEELVEELMNTKWFKLKTPKHIHENTRTHHKKEVLIATNRIAERLGYFNQNHIYADEEMATLLKGFVDDIGRHRSYSEGKVTSWISEKDPRPKSERRGRPKGSKKER